MVSSGDSILATAKIYLSVIISPAFFHSSPLNSHISLLVSRFSSKPPEHRIEIKSVFLLPCLYLGSKRKSPGSMRQHGKVVWAVAVKTSRLLHLERGSLLSPGGCFHPILLPQCRSTNKKTVWVRQGRREKQTISLTFFSRYRIPHPWLSRPVWSDGKVVDPPCSN